MSVYDENRITDVRMIQHYAERLGGKRLMMNADTKYREEEGEPKSKHRKLNTSIRRIVQEKATLHTCTIRNVPAQVSPHTRVASNSTKKNTTTESYKEAT